MGRSIRREFQHISGRSASPFFARSSALRDILSSLPLDSRATNVSFGKSKTSARAQKMWNQQTPLPVRRMRGRNRASPREGSTLPRGGRRPPRGFTPPSRRIGRKSKESGSPSRGRSGPGRHRLNRTPTESDFPGGGSAPPLGRAQPFRGRAPPSPAFSLRGARRQRQIARRVDRPRGRVAAGERISAKNSGRARVFQGRPGSSPGEG